MRGAIVINGYLNGPKFMEPAEMMVEAAKRHEVEMGIYLNTDLTVPIGDIEGFRRILGDTDFIIFWDKDVKLAKNLEICDFPVFNCSECIRLCDDKALTHLTLEEWGIPSIRTLMNPMSFGYSYDEWLSKAKVTLGYPMVVKECFGSFGEQVRMVRDDNDLMKEGNPGTPKVFQEYVDCGATDLRIEVVGGRVAAAVKRSAKAGDFRSNASRGGIMTDYKPTEEEATLAIEAASALQAEFAGVDILPTKNGPIVCEVNSNAHIKNLREATGIDVSDDILEHIINFLK